MFSFCYSVRKTLLTKTGNSVYSNLHDFVCEKLKDVFLNSMVSFVTGIFNFMTVVTPFREERRNIIILHYTACIFMSYKSMIFLSF